MSRVVCAACAEEGRDGCYRCGVKRPASRHFRILVEWTPESARRIGTFATMQVTACRAEYTLVSTRGDDTEASVETETLATFGVRREDCTHLIVRELFVNPETGETFTLERM